MDHGNGGMHMQDEDDQTCLRDDWSRLCITLSSEQVRILAVFFCCVVLLNVGVYLIYAICLCYTHRSINRVMSFGLVTLGLTLSLPQALVRIGDPHFNYPNSIPHLVLFAVGDITDHVGILMLIYWDICTEAVDLVYALDPKQHSCSLRRLKMVGIASMISQVFILGSLFTMVYLLERHEDRCTTFTTFTLVQLGAVFGFAPTVAFGMLVRGLHRLWNQLPGDVPRRLVHRLRYTQLGLGTLMLLCASFVPSAVLLGTVPFFQVKAGFLYVFVVLTLLGLDSSVLLFGELILTLKSIRSKANRPIPLSPAVLEELVQAGTQQLAWNNMTRIQSAPPVWDRGCAHAVARSFLDLVPDESDKLTMKTTDLCMKLLKPMTLEARCSVWESLAAGFPTLAKHQRAFDRSASMTMNLSMHHYIGKPDTFVSHCWASHFWELLEIVQRYDENTNRNNFFFLDVFSMNQHDFADISGEQMDELKACTSPQSITSSATLVGLKDIYQTMLKALTRSIETPGRVLLALTPHEQPLLLTRSWCLYEIYIAWKVGAEVSCGFVPEAEQSVKNSLVESDALIKTMLNAVDAENSRATMETDRKMILSLIEQAGFNRFNTFVREKLSASLRMVALTTLVRSNTKNLDIKSEAESESISSRARSVSGATRSDFVLRDRLAHLYGLDSEEEEDEFSI